MGWIGKVVTGAFGGIGGESAKEKRRRYDGRSDSVDEKPDLQDSGEVRFRVYKHGTLINEVEVSRDFIRIGRDPACDLHIDESFISLIHGAIEVDAYGNLTFTDLGGVTDTRVNGVPVYRATLQSGDSIEIGFVRIEVLLGHERDSLESSSTSQESDDDVEVGEPNTRILTPKVEYELDEVGISLSIDLGETFPSETRGCMQALDENGRFLRGLSPFTTIGGKFIVISPVNDGICHIYIPIGALCYVDAGQYDLAFKVIRANTEEITVEVMGVATFQCHLPAPRPWLKSEWLSPLIELCMAVVYADGKVLPEEVHHVRTYFEEVFELRKDDLEGLKNTMKKQPSKDLNIPLKKIAHRLPNLKAEELLTVLADTAKCDGEAHATEVEVIKEISKLMGFDEEQWWRLESDLGLKTEEKEPPPRPSSLGISLEEAYAVLKIEQGATRPQIQAAYRKLVSDYHPDRVATLPKEFQEVAHKKMTEINVAYERVKLEM